MIKNLKAYPAFDSLGGRALSVRAFTENCSCSASVPVKGDLEKLLKIFSSIRPNFIGLDEKDWQSADAFLQELTPKAKSLTLAVSLAIARSGCDNDLWRLGTERAFPFPLANVISNAEGHEFFIIPRRAGNPQHAAETCLEAYDAALEELRKVDALKGRSPDGSWFCGLDLLKALEFLSSLAEDWELKMGVGLASGLWNGKAYALAGKSLGPEGCVDFLEEISYTYKIYYMEDPFHREDFASFSGLAARLKRKLVVGNRLYRSEGERLKRGLGLKSGNGVVINPARAGTLLETLRLSGLARKGGISPITSQGQRETGDSCLADISLLSGAPLLKTGLSCGGLARLSRLIELWEEVPEARMAGLP